MFDNRIKELQAKIKEAGGMENYQRQMREKQLKSAYVYDVATFDLVCPHNRPYLTITTTKHSIPIEFGEVGLIEEIRYEDNSIAVMVRNRPFDIGCATVPRLERFRFESVEKMTSFINQVMIAKRIF